LLFPGLIALYLTPAVMNRTYGRPRQKSRFWRLKVEEKGIWPGQLTPRLPFTKSLVFILFYRQS